MAPPATAPNLLYNDQGVSDGSAEVFVPAAYTPQITLSSVTNENNALVLSFTVDRAEGLSALAALASPHADLSQPTKGPDFAVPATQVWVRPEANPGDTVYVAVAAYAGGVEAARSPTAQTTYQPVQPPAPPPAPLAMPNLHLRWRRTHSAQRARS